ncbi:MAG: hypothetical protein A2161_04265 [Candidatus Schekmanbacteria bacterium RBG_13_48_7]|uniref:Uncharacterized protein n=1 Tax=Candidatus Schekmanbacteria bacterium RBG_13_48_7 TaxID=1817878 RepID=A0A1F7RMW0_9BACT|nr:MAG: hypothetical protein A2161_04265 [Candidatus Schekmanbacteria bacterium RBG_13_48_7]
MKTMIKLCNNQCIHHGDFNLKIISQELITEDKEMSEYKTDTIKENTVEKNQLTVTQADPEYCEFCFLSFGSQEKRIHKNGKIVHERCATRLEPI